MPVMSEFFFYCSVRLGAIVAGVISILQTIVPLIVLLAFGASSLRDGAIDLQNDKNDDPEYFEIVMKYVEKDPETFFMVVVGSLCVYLAVCCLEIFGAFKLLKWLLIPYITLECIRLLILCVLHVVGMMILKNSINLGTLIGITVFGGFGLLLLIYIWSCVIALFQVITVINTDKYKNLYGSDPLAPWKPSLNPLRTLPPAAGQSAHVENVKFYPSPDFSTYSPKKIGRKAGLKNQSIFETYQQPLVGNAALSQNDVFSREFLELQHRTMR